MNYLLGIHTYLLGGGDNISWDKHDGNADLRRNDQNVKRYQNEH